MDPQQASLPTDQQPVAAEAASASESPRESESRTMNNLFRRAAGWVFGRGDDATSDRPAEQPAAQDAATTEESVEQPASQPVQAEQPERHAYTPAEIDKLVQSRSDQILARREREGATERANTGDLEPMRRLAERGDPWAKHQLAVNGDTWALGEIEQKRLQDEATRAADPVPQVATTLDQAMLHPILAALPREDEERIVGSGILGADGRHRAVTEAIAALKRHAADDALAKAIDDPAYAETILREGSALRAAILKNPTTNKQLRGMFLGERQEPDLAPGVSAGRTGQRENDVMNDLFRRSWQQAAESGEDERAAMGAGGRLTHRDLLDDDA